MEKLLITDTFKAWRDKINAVLETIGSSPTVSNGELTIGEDNGASLMRVEVPATFEDKVTVGTSVVIDGEAGTITANADTATKLKSPVTISVTDGSHTSTPVSFDGSSNITLSLPDTIEATLAGNADTASKLSKSFTINGTAFDGSKNITTANWGTQRSVTVSDASGGNTGEASTVDGSDNINLKLPNTIQVENIVLTKMMTGPGGIDIDGDIIAENVWNAVWNDYAEFFERGCDTEPGDIIALDESFDGERYIKATEKSKFIVGVHSDTYGHIVGGYGTSIKDAEKNFIPVGLAGRVNVKFKGIAERGMQVVPSDIPGVGRAFAEGDDPKSIIGYLLVNDSSDEVRRLKMKIE